MSRGARHAGQGGFTLVEMLLAVALLSLLFGVFGGLLFRLQKTGAAVAALEAAEDVGVVRRYVATSLEGSRTMLSPAAGGRRIVRFAGAAHRIAFAGVADGAREVGGVYETSLWVDDAGRLLLLRQPLGWGDRIPAPPRVLLRGVAGLAFTYFPCPARAGSTGRQAWTGEDHLPFRITLTLTFKQGDARTWPVLSAFPEASACRIGG